MKYKLGRMLPRRYSGRIEVTGADGEPFLPAATAAGEIMNDERVIEAARRIAFVLHRADVLQKQQEPPAPVRKPLPALPSPKKPDVIFDRQGNIVPSIDTYKGRDSLWRE